MSSKKRPYRWTSVRRLVAGAVRFERAACVEEAEAWCSCKIDPKKACVACAVVAAIQARDAIVPGHHKKCPLSQPSNERFTGAPDAAWCCCVRGEV